ISATGMPLIRNVSDTARWAAMFRAKEMERADALFRDPFAAGLAGERGAQIYREMPEVGGRDTSWSWVLRTVLFDRAILKAIGEGFDTILNLAAGLDARPYRLELPPKLQWIEVDLPPMVEEKEELLRGEKPTCRLERVPLDLADVAARRKLFDRINASATRVLVITEGLLVYLERESAAALARDLASEPAFRRWALDIMSPGLLQMILKSWSRNLGEANAPPQFAPEEGPRYFERAGWTPVEVSSVLKAAAKAKRVPLLFRLAALLPDPKDGRAGKRPWSATCVMERA
ncbi:MAG: class I SAM-dependent methyltransferase, partial [Thermoanaerobaculia bacterium]